MDATVDKIMSADITDILQTVPLAQSNPAPLRKRGRGCGRRLPTVRDDEGSAVKHCLVTRLPAPPKVPSSAFTLVSGELLSKGRGRGVRLPALPKLPPLGDDFRGTPASSPIRLGSLPSVTASLVSQWAAPQTDATLPLTVDVISIPSTLLEQYRIATPTGSPGQLPACLQGMEEYSDPSTAGLPWGDIVEIQERRATGPASASTTQAIDTAPVSLLTITIPAQGESRMVDAPASVTAGTTFGPVSASSTAFATVTSVPVSAVSCNAGDARFCSNDRDG